MRSHSEQKMYPNHENISVFEDQNLWSFKDLVLMNLPFPSVRNHFATSFWAGIGKDSAMCKRSQMNWHVPPPAASQRCHELLLSSSFSAVLGTQQERSG